MNNKRYYLTFSLLILFCMLGGITYIVDGSGSMKGFAREGSVKTQVEDIINASKKTSSPGRIQLFISKDTTDVDLREIDLSDLDNPSRFSGKHTLLSKTANKVLSQPGNYVLITDNVEDDSATKGDVTKFYKTLMESPQISSVDISPRITQFYGNPHRGGSNLHSGDFGMLVYFITVGSHQDYTRERNSLLQSLESQGYDIFHLRPITSDHIRLTSPKDNKSPFVIYSEKGKYHLKIRSEAKNVPVFQIDKEIPIEFSILMHSHYNYIGIRENTDVEIDNFTISHNGSPLKMERPKISINPTQLPKSLEKGGVQKFDIKLLLKPIKPSLRERLFAMFNPKRYVVSFDISLKTSDNSIYMVEAKKNQYFTDKLSQYDKIYSRPQDMISHFNPQNNRIIFHVENKNNPQDASTQIRLMYDNLWFFLVLVGIVLALIAVTYFIYRWNQTPNKLFVTIETRPLGDIMEKELPRLGSLPLESCTVKRKLTGTIIRLNDKNRFYFADSIFPVIDLPLKVTREINERETNKKIIISISKNRRKDA